MKVNVTIESENKAKLRRIIDTTEVAVDDNGDALCMLVSKEHFFWLIKRATLLESIEQKTIDFKNGNHQ